MALYLDSASLDDARQSAALGYVAGITTNPSLMAASGRAPADVIAGLCDVHPGMVFYQPVAADVAAREAEVRRIAGLRPGRVGIKLPSTPDNFALAARLAVEGFTVGMTTIFSPAQALVACQVGARYVLPYVNRSTRLLGDGPGLVREMRAVIDADGSAVQILAASIKSPAEAVDTVLAGAHSLTLPLALIAELGHHELSERAIAEFAASASGTPAGAP
jgi:transaldolase